jgi:hypothetical protein
MKLTNLVLPTLLVILLCLVTTVALRQSRMSSEIPPLPAELSTAVVMQGESERGPVRMIRFVLLDTGLYPRTMRVDKGLINLAVEDETGISEGLVVERLVATTRERITTIRRMANARRGRELVRLTPGQYVVYDAGKPNNKANLIVEP